MKTIFRLLLTAAFHLSLGSSAASAGEFSVNPIRLELGANARSSVIGIKNEGKTTLSFQLQAKEWTQDSAGKDLYADTQDLVFFPKILSVKPDEEGLIRVGSKVTAVPQEKTYRLFIEELPSAKSAPEGSAAQINVLIRFGAPIFIGPLKPQDNLEIESFTLSKGVVSIFAKNTGNRHQVVQGINLKGIDSAGKEIYALTLADRYLLTGTSKSYSTTIAAEQCGKLASLALELKTDKSSASQKLDVSGSMCR